MAHMGHEWIWLHSRCREPTAPACLCPWPWPPPPPGTVGCLQPTQGDEEQLTGLGLASVYVKPVASCQLFFLTYLLSASWQAALWGKWAEKGLTVPGILQLWCCNESQPEPMGMGRGAVGWGHWAPHIHCSLFAIIP